MKFIFLVLSLSVGHIQSLIAAVRHINTTERAIHPIYLSMGRSTILHFQERPKKVVCGNKNYFNIEFIENDLAIQPLRPAVTNLFVYTESHTYGFTLGVNTTSTADDLVHVDWEEHRKSETVVENLKVRNSETLTRPFKPLAMHSRSIKKIIRLAPQLEMRLEKWVEAPSKNLKWVELSLLSKEKEIHIQKDLKLFLEPEHKEVRLICGGETLPPQKSQLCRVFVTNNNRALRIKFIGRDTSVNF